MLSFSERVKSLRTENNLTQKKIAAAIGISERGYINLGSGVKRLFHYVPIYSGSEPEMIEWIVLPEK